MLEESSQDDLAAVENCAAVFQKINDELSKVIVGQKDAI